MSRVIDPQDNPPRSAGSPPPFTGLSASNRLRWLFVVIVALLSAFRLWYAGSHGLALDEAYYWMWARRLAPGYYDQGPGVALAIRIGIAFGSGPGAVRLMAVADAAVLSLLAYLLTSRIFRSEYAGFSAGVFVNVVPLLFVGGILMTHDSPQMATWAAAVYCLARALGVGDPRRSEARTPGSADGAWWIAAGLLAGASLDCKFTAVLFFPCALISILGTAWGRATLRTPWPYLMALCGGLAAIPPVYWNATHEWASARHILNLGGEHQSHFIQMGTVGDFLAGQFLLTLLFFFTLIWAAAICWRRDRNSGDDGLWLAGCFSAPVWLFFLLLSFHSQVEPNWPVPAYFTAACVAPWMALKGILSAARGKAAALRVFHAVSCLLAVVEIAIVLFPQVILWFPGGRQSLDRMAPKADRTNEMYGWDQLASAMETAGWRPGGDWAAAASRYQEAAELSFSLPGQPITFNVPVVRRRNQFDFWPPLPDGARALVVIPSADGDLLTAQLQRLFARVSVAAEVPVWRRPLHSKPIAEYIILRCEGYKGGRNGLLGAAW